MKKFRRITRLGLSIIAIAFVVGTSLATLVDSSDTSALSGSQFNRANIISDGIFFNESSMTASQIQSFLNSKVPTCDTNGTQPYGGTTRAAYGTSRGYPPPYTCLKSYTQNIPSKSADAYCSGGITGGTKSAAQIIYDVARACDVSPKTLIVLLQKEQSLITDDWPWSIQYRSATGYGCPDTAACDSAYYGFFNQVYNAARQFQRYVAQPEFFNYASGRTSFISYQANAPSCGGSNVGIQNGATAALYNYTPYQPNAAALANLYGTGDSCSAYGNRNFWRMFNDWFGSTTMTYSGSVSSVRTYTDSAQTVQVSNTPSIRSGQTFYVRAEVINTGSRTWYKSNTRIGTRAPFNRSSAFANDSWLSAARPTSMNEASVGPNETATFDFSMTAPAADGEYSEVFNVVLDGLAWVPTSSFSLNITVATPYNASIVSVQAFTDSSRTDRTGFLSLTNEPLYWKIRARNTGTNTWSNSNVRIGTSNPFNRPSALTNGSWLSAARPAALSESSVAPGSIGTFLYTTNSSSAGRYEENFSLLAEGVSWMPNGAYSTDVRFTDKIDRLVVGERLYRGETLRNGTIRMVLQGDGNLVVYNASGKPVWSSSTRDGNRLIMQGDGNLVMYNGANRPVWATHTQGGNRLIMQGDGNLVMYNGANRPIWNSGTKR